MSDGHRGGVAAYLNRDPVNGGAGGCEEKSNAPAFGDWEFG